MEFLKNLKLNKWYVIVLYLGVGALIASLSFEIEFIEKKYLFGLGIALIMIGLGFIGSEKTHNEIAFGGILSWPIHKHNFFTVTSILIGIILLGLFGFKIIADLL
ncbi:hypothetical protein [Winogradskyella sp.]|uniref:hypothetical protein n=1 Tax=Winogradskyella sp. TaxID=1883156 RepID=UPI003BAA21C0